MQRCCFWLTMWLVLFGSTSREHFANERPSSEQFAEWVRTLSSYDKAAREQVAELILSNIWSSIDSSRTGEGNKEPEFTEMIRDTLKRSQEDLLSILKQPDLDSSAPVTAASLICLACMKDDGSVLKDALKDELRGNSDLELAAIQVLFTTTLYTMPKNDSVVSSFLTEMDHLSPLARTKLEGLTASDLNSLNTQAQLVGVAQAMVKTDRTLCEVPHLVEALNDKYPIFVRLCAVELLAELGDESGKALPKLNELLGDESESLRFAAACAIVRIEPRTDTKKLSASLEPVDRKKFLEWSSSYQKKYANRDLPEAAVLHLLQSTHPFYQRKVLRMLLQTDQIPDTGKTRLNELLRAPDHETRELARQVLKKY
ncbi:MAG: HEAT repeat domain-containing protein [Planctomycetaceae bacterium]|nr:HEAT repeat domain-containing protein [Planctomycetaceae bacterium]